MIPIKQMLGDKKCLGCVAAMAADTNLKEFEDFLMEANLIYPIISISPPWTSLELNAYLLKFGLKIGQTFNLRNKNFSLDADNEIIQCCLTIRNQPAAVTVKSENYPNTLHSIFWDGYQIYDPNPKVDNGRPLSDYRIREWEPITPI
jgi:hypothetical protein